MSSWTFFKGARRFQIISNGDPAPLLQCTQYLQHFVGGSVRRGIWFKPDPETTETENLDLRIFDAGKKLKHTVDG